MLVSLFAITTLSTPVSSEKVLFHRHTVSSDLGFQDEISISSFLRVGLEPMNLENIATNHSQLQDCTSKHSHLFELVWSREKPSRLREKRNLFFFRRETHWSPYNRETTGTGTRKGNVWKHLSFQTGSRSPVWTPQNPLKVSENTFLEWRKLQEALLISKNS